MEETKLLERITCNPQIFGGKPIIRGRRLAVEHVLGMLAKGDTPELLMQGYPWLEPEDVQACLVYARRLVGHERNVCESEGVGVAIATSANDRRAILDGFRPSVTMNEWIVCINLLLAIFLPAWVGE